MCPSVQLGLSLREHADIEDRSKIINALERRPFPFPTHRDHHVLLVILQSMRFARRTCFVEHKERLIHLGIRNVSPFQTSPQLLPQPSVTSTKTSSQSPLILESFRGGTRSGVGPLKPLPMHLCSCCIQLHLPSPQILQSFFSVLILAW